MCLNHSLREMPSAGQTSFHLTLSYSDLVLRDSVSVAAHLGDDETRRLCDLGTTVL